MTTNDSFDCQVDGCGYHGTCVKCDNDCDQQWECACHDNYLGEDCSIPVEYCGAPNDTKTPTPYYCLNGGTCTPGDNDNDQDPDSWSCDCQTAVGDATAFVGHLCEYAAETSCEKGQATSSYAFCVNGGQCVRLVEPGQPHPGCHLCDKGYEGRHCQYAAGTAPLHELEHFVETQVGNHHVAAHHEETAPTAVLVVLALVAAGLLLGSIFMTVHYWKRFQRPTTTVEVEEEENAKNNPPNVDYQQQQATDLKPSLTDATANSQSPTETMGGSSFQEDSEEEVVLC